MRWATWSNAITIATRRGSKCASLRICTANLRRSSCRNCRRRMELKNLCRSRGDEALTCFYMKFQKQPWLEMEQKILESEQTALSLLTQKDLQSVRKIIGQFSSKRNAPHGSAVKNRCQRGRK